MEQLIETLSEKKPYLRKSVPALVEALGQSGAPLLTQERLVRMVTSPFFHASLLGSFESVVKAATAMIQGWGEGQLEASDLPLQLLNGSLYFQGQCLNAPSSSYATKVATVAQRYLGNQEDDNHQRSREILTIVKNKHDDVGVFPLTGDIVASSLHQTQRFESDVFEVQEGVVYARLGPYHFIDASLQPVIPSDVTKGVEDQFFFLPEMNRSELNDRLGYYTLNTMTAMMQSDLKGKYVIDCGSGTGILSLAAKRFGAAGVLAVDMDAKAQELAARSLELNGYSGDPTMVALTTDLRNRGSVLHALMKMPGSGDVALISNIGAWNDYPISNLTALSYHSDLEWFAEWPVTNVICGGYSGHLESLHITHAENAWLNSLSINPRRLPMNAYLFDQLVLSQLGFEPVVDVQSEQLQTLGDFGHQAKSFAVHRSRRS